MLLLEDVDAIGGKRAITTTAAEGSDDKEMDDQGVSLSGILNVLDGVFSPEGVIIIMTTNYKDKLEPALVGPGRVDRAVEFTAATKFQAKSLFENVFCKHLDEQLEILAEQFASKVGKGRTPADIQNYLQGFSFPKNACNPTSEKDRLWFLDSHIQCAEGTARNDDQGIGICNDTAITVLTVSEK